jgi:hypothetical protein
MMHPLRPSPGAPGSRVNPAGARILETPYCRVEWDDERSLARFVRTALPYATPPDIALEGILVQRALEKAGRGRLLVDLRAVAMRNDPGFEAAIATFRRRLLRGSGRTAVLARTAVGMLQVKRYAREDGFQVEVFDQEEAALAFIETPASPGPRRGAEPAPSPLVSSWKHGPFYLR